MVTPAAAAASDLGATVSSSAPAAAPAATIGDDVIGDLTSSHGLTVSEVDRVDERLVRLTVASQELARPVRLTLLLPQGYTATTRRYPTLYLLHGTSGGADDWVQQGEAEDITAGFPMIVVMPDGGYDSNGGGWWTDWVDQDTALGVANWETFHIEQLVPWVDAHLRTRARRSQRAIAGLSQGGFGAMSYASRHPDLFVSAASFSGAPDIAKAPQARTLGAAVVGAIMTGLNGVQPHAPFGDPVLDAVKSSTTTGRAATAGRTGRGTWPSPFPASPRSSARTAACPSGSTTAASTVGTPPGAGGSVPGASPHRRSAAWCAPLGRASSSLLVPRWCAPRPATDRSPPTGCESRVNAPEPGPMPGDGCGWLCPAAVASSGYRGACPAERGSQPSAPGRGTASPAVTPAGRPPGPASGRDS